MQGGKRVGPLVSRPRMAGFAPYVGPVLPQHPSGVFHTHVAKQALDLREVRGRMLMPCGAGLYESVWRRARAALHHAKDRIVPVTGNHSTQAVPASSVLVRPPMPRRLMSQRKSRPVSGSNSSIKPKARPSPGRQVRVARGIRPHKSVRGEALQPSNNPPRGLHDGPHRHTKVVGNRIHSRQVPVCTQTVQRHGHLHFQWQLAWPPTRTKQIVRVLA